MNITDKQDVMTMFNLMQLIWSLPPPLATNNPIHYETHIALNQYSKLLCYLILPYINVDMNLHEQLKSLSAVALSWYASSAHPQPSLTPSAYTLVSLQYTLRKLAQPRHSCCRTKLGSMSNFPGLCPYVSGRHLFVFFSICRICLMHFH